MTWTYIQSTGRLTHDGQMIATGYSGKRDRGGKNNPSKEVVPFVGPIPRGQYRIGNSFKHEKLGSVAMRLTPVGHTAYGRTLFLIHGDKISDQGNGSDGCLILGLSIRPMIASSNDKILEVIR